MTDETVNNHFGCRDVLKYLHALERVTTIVIIASAFRARIQGITRIKRDANTQNDDTSCSTRIR